MTSTQGGVMTAPTDPGDRSVSTDGAATRQASIRPNREGMSASGRQAERSDVDTPDLQTLAVRASQGDMDAAGDIYRQFVEPVYRYVARKVTGRETAQDVTSTVFVNALRGLQHADWQGRDLGAWLFTIAHNAVMSHYRSKYVRWEECSADLDETQVPDISDRSALSASLWAAVRRLPEEDRKLVAFRFLLDLSIAETAVVLGVCEGTVKSRTNRVISQLREDLSAVTG